MEASLETITETNQRLFICREFHLPAFDAPWHFHPEIELTYIVKGRGTRLVGDSIEPFCEGELVLLGSELPHRWINDHVAEKRKDYARSIVTQFRPSIFAKDWRLSEEFHSIEKMLQRASRGLSFSANSSLVKALQEANQRSGIGQSLSIIELLHRLSEAPARPLASLLYATTVPQDHNHPVHAAHQFILKHHSEPITLTQIAHASGIAPNSLCRAFKKSSGKSVFDFLSDIRIHKACALLIESDMQITTIAYECGFQSLSAFQKAFQRIKKTSPRAFREPYRSN